MEALHLIHCVLFVSKLQTYQTDLRGQERRLEALDGSLSVLQVCQVFTTRDCELVAGGMRRGEGGGVRWRWGKWERQRAVSQGT